MVMVMAMAMAMAMIKIANDRESDNGKAVAEQ